MEADKFYVMIRSWDTGSGEDVCVMDKYIQPTPEFPEGSWLRVVAGVVEVATGIYEKDYPGRPSPYFQGRAPFVIVDTSTWTDFDKEKTCDTKW